MVIVVLELAGAAAAVIVKVAVCLPAGIMTVSASGVATARLPLVIWITSQRNHVGRVIWAALVFGAFYIALGILGLTLERPFGLLLGPGEDVFHFTVGPLASLEFDVVKLKAN